MMNRLFCGALALCICLLSACARGSLPEKPTELPETLAPMTSEPDRIQPTEAAPPETSVPEAVQTEPLHSPLYIPGVSVEDILLYFNEVCLDSEIINSGDPSYVQKWVKPIFYRLEGNYTQEDLSVFHAFELWLNQMEEFPGIYPADDTSFPNLRVHFCTQEEMLALMGPDFEYMDGAVTFWYENDEIYDAVICIRTDLSQELRNSVILEELYNGLGPIQDTNLRPDSIICQEFAQNQWLSSVDEVILQLLYHPDILPGMSAQQCGQVIRTLYF